MRAFSTSRKVPKYLMQKILDPQIFVVITFFGQVSSMISYLNKTLKLAGRSFKAVPKYRV